MTRNNYAADTPAEQSPDWTSRQLNLELGKTPVAFIVFNRPEHTRAAFAAIRGYRPSRLFLIADGPRTHYPLDAVRCQDVRHIVSEVDWPCEVRTNFSNHNLGCSLRVSSGLDWVFSEADRAIVLEDDCVASPEFFSFCDQILEAYENNEAVWVVSGNSYQPEIKRGDGSYYFSKYPDCWGWATWRRAWRHYQNDLPFLDEWQRTRRWKECFPTLLERRYFDRVFRGVLRGATDSWGYRWLACMIYGGGLAATPNANLVQNIGFDGEGTHTTNRGNPHPHCPTQLGPMKHPTRVAPDVEADDYLRIVVEQRGWSGVLRRLPQRAAQLVQRIAKVDLIGPGRLPR